MTEVIGAYPPGRVVIRLGVDEGLYSRAEEVRSLLIVGREIVEPKQREHEPVQDERRGVRRILLEGTDDRKVCAKPSVAHVEP